MEANDFQSLRLAGRILPINLELCGVIETDRPALSLAKFGILFVITILFGCGSFLYFGGKTCPLFAATLHAGGRWELAHGAIRLRCDRVHKHGDKKGQLTSLPMSGGLVPFKGAEEHNRIAFKNAANV